MKPRVKSTVEAILLLIVAIILFMQCAIGQIAKDKNDKTLSPYFFVKSNDASLEQMPLKMTSADVNISGVIADVKVTQVYCNTGKSTIEAIYVFPGSTRAAVYAMQMHVGSRVLIAKIQERNKARQTYENAKKEGKTTSLLEQQRPNVFQMNVANILPGDTIRVELKYTELLVPTDGVYEFIYPTVVGPRYSNQKSENAQQDEKWIANPYTTENVKPLYTFDIKTRINAGMGIKEIKCGTHDLNYKFESKSIATCSLKDNNKFEGNRDYILQYRLTDNKIESGLLLFKGDKENFFLAMIQPPVRPTKSQIPPREYIFIIDVSGSMYGFPLNISKKVIVDLLKNLRSSDKFNILFFSGGNSVLSETSLDVNEENIQKAVKMVERQQGGGGTELLPALKRSMSLPKAENCSRSYIIATDGYVQVEKEAFDFIRGNLNNANFFAFGIGTSVNRFLMEGMARVGMGEPFIVTNEQEAIEKAEKFREYIQSPVLTNIKMDYSNFEVYDVEPLTVPDVLAQRPVLVYGKWKGNPSGTIKLTGYSGESKYETTLDVSAAKPESKNIALQYLWARYKIQLLDDYNSVRQSEENKNAVTELGLKYNLLTKYTSFVAVDSVVRNQGGNQTTVNQPLPLPQGVSNYAVGEVSKSTSYSEEKESDDAFSNYKSKRDMSLGTKSEDKQVFAIVEENPEFPGGEAAMKNYVSSNLVYPKAARENNIQGKVYVRFAVNPDGSISDIKVIRSVDPLLDKEAIRIIKNMPKWKPAKQKGKPVKTWFTVPIDFKLQ